MRTPLLTTSEKMANLQSAVIDRRYASQKSMRALIVIVRAVL